MRFHWRFSLVLVTLLAFTNKVRAQRSEFKYIYKFSVKEGLSSYNIRKIARDEYGYMWVATQEGLNRFDGKRFIQYNQGAPSPFKLPASDIRDISCDSLQHQLWILTNVAGIFKINTTTGNVISNIPIPYTHADDWSHCFLVTASDIWVGGLNGIRIFNRKSNKWLTEPEIPFATSANHEPYEIGSILQDNKKNVLVFVNGYGLLVFDPVQKTLISAIPGSTLSPGATSKINYNGAVEYADKQFITGTSRGPQAFQLSSDYQMLHPTVNLPILANLTEPVSAIAKGNNDEIYISFQSGTGCIRNNLKEISWIKDKDGQSENSDWLGHAKSLFDDGTFLWIGSNEGLCYFAKKSFAKEVYSSAIPAFSSLSHVFDIEPVNSNQLLVGTKSGLFLINRAAQSCQSILNNVSVNNLFPDFKGNIIASTNAGNFVYRSNYLIPWSTLYPELKPFDHTILLTAVESVDSTILIATDDESGLITWNPFSKKTGIISKNSRPISLGSSTINGLFRNRSGEIIVLGDKVITLLSANLGNSKTINIVDQDSKKEMGPFFDITETDSNYWIAAYGNGLIEVDKQWHLRKIYQENLGLTNSGVYKLFNDRDSLLYITSNNGISIFNLLNRTSSLQFEENGLHANTFEEATGSFVNNEIFTGGPHGFSVISPGSMQFNSSPPEVFINQYSIQRLNKSSIDSFSNNLATLIIPDNYTQALIYFSAIGFDNPAKTIYQYRLVELQKDWIDLGKQDFITLVGVAPGKYNLEVRARNVNGGWGKVKSLLVRFRPKWFQTWWFKGLLVLIFMGIVYGLYVLRIRQLKKEQAIRGKLASDLHDDLGSTLNSVKVYANLALMENGSDTYLVKIKEGTQEAITGIRDMIWVLDDKKDTIGDLLTRISQFAAPFCEAKQIRFLTTADASNQDYKIESSEKRNLFLIMKEFVNNSIKYSDATEVRITILSFNGKIRIELKDNGKGFDPEVNTEGKGLTNMRYRAGEIKYKFDIRSAKGEGISVNLQKD